MPMKNMSWGVGFDEKDRIITSDAPVYIHKNSNTQKEYDRIVFPISSKICLFLFGNEEKECYPKNFLFPIKDSDRRYILKTITLSSFEYIYSNHLLDDNEKRIIKKVKKKKKYNITN